MMIGGTGRATSRIHCIAPLLLLSALLVGCMQSGSPREALVSDDWLGYGRDEGEQRFSPLTQINADNVN